MEVVWARRLELVLGNSVRAAATITAVYMLGLGLGAFFVSRSPRVAWLRARPIRSYALLEVAVAGWALVSLPLISLVGNLANGLARAVGGADIEGTPLVLRIVAAVLVLLPPTLLMGGSLPLLARGLAGQEASFSRRFGLLYGLNTLGAMAGAVGAGFVLLPRLGLLWTLVVGAGLCLAAAVLAIATAGKAEGSDEPKADAEEPTSRARWPLILAALSGALALALEVVWFRALVMVFGSTTYSIAVMLGIFLGASAIGALLASVLCRYVGKRWIPMIAGISLVVAGALVLQSILWFGGSPQAFVEGLAEDFTWENLLIRKLALALRLIALPTVCLGLVLPLAAVLVRSSTGSAQAAGSVYLANALGSTAGVLFGGFVLLPLVGLRYSLLILGAACAVFGIVVGLAQHRESRPAAAPYFAIIALAVAGFLGAIAWSQPWDAKSFALGAYFGATSHSGSGNVRFDELLHTSRLRYYEEGATSTVAVLEGHRNNLHFTANGKVEADTSPHSMINQRLVGHLPMLLHPAGAKSVLNVGLGAGVTAGAMASHPNLVQFDVVEIEPAARGVAEVFSELNENLLDHPKLRLVWNDARNFLEVTPHRYDVISSDPFEPVVAGAIHLFTREHYELARSRLAEGGVLCQWIPMYEMSQDDYAALVKTFSSVFPGALLFSTGADSILIGFREEQGQEELAGRIRSRMADTDVAASLAGVGFHSAESILGLLVGSVAPDDAELAGLEVMNDGWPHVEYSAPKNAILPTYRANREVQIALFEQSIASSDPTSPVTAQRRAVLDALRSGLVLGVDPAQARSLAESARALVKDHPIVNQEAYQTFHALGAAALGRGELAAATQLLAKSLECRSDEFRPAYSLALCQLRMGNLPLAKQLIDHGSLRFANSPYFPSLRAAIHRSDGELADACVQHENAIRRAPRLEQSWTQYADTVRQARDPRVDERFRRFRVEMGR